LGRDSHPRNDDAVLRRIVDEHLALRADLPA
jgi:hypothetical protein